MKRRPTIQREPRADLSQAVEDHYLAYFENEGRGAEFTAWMNAVREHVMKTAVHGADSGFVLHALICTWDRRTVRHADSIDAIRRLGAGDRTLLIGALRLLRKLGEAWLAEVLGPAEPGQAMRLLTTASQLETALTGVVVRTPAWQSGALARARTRFEEDAVTACIVCLLDELKHKSKPAATAAVILEKARLLRRTRGGAAASKMIEKRAERARKKAKDPLGPVGNIVWLLRSSYTELRESLLTIPDIEDSDGVWTQQARAWRTTPVRYRQAFRGYCRARGWRGHSETLARFQAELSDVRRREGQSGVTRVLRNLAGEMPWTQRPSERRRGV